MNERIRELAEQAGINCVVPAVGSLEILGQGEIEHLEKFAELIIRECIKESMEEIVQDNDIEEESDPLLRCLLRGNNQGIVDAVVRFRNHFGVE